MIFLVLLQNGCVDEILLLCKVWLITGLFLIGFKDLRDRKIPNFASFSLLVLSFFIRTLSIKSGTSTEIGLIVGLIIGLVILAKVKVIGGGDFKTLTAGCLSFPMFSFYSIIFSILLTAILVTYELKPPIIFFFTCILLSLLLFSFLTSLDITSFFQKVLI